MKCEKYVTLIKGFTQDYPFAENMEFPFIFFDASHGNEIQQEFDTWYPYIPSGGYMIVHDYGMDKHPKITQIVDKFIVNNNIKMIKRVNRSVVLRKNDVL